MTLHTVLLFGVGGEWRWLALIWLAHSLIHSLPPSLPHYSKTHQAAELQSQLEAARARMPGADVHALVAEWQALWARTGRQRLRSADAAFLGWIARRAADGPVGP